MTIYQQVQPDIYRIEVPLPDNPLRAVNCFVVNPRGRALIVDTGMNCPESRDALFGGLKELEVDLPQARLFITHMHVDHAGLAAAFAGGVSRIFINSFEGEMVNKQDFWPHLLELARSNGFPAENLQEAFDSHPAYRYSSREPVDFTYVAEGDCINAGEYRFECVHTPGHTLGHLCLYDKERKLLLAGDHLLSSITPNISMWEDKGRNSLQLYLDSLDKVAGLDVKLVLPGHREPFSNFHETIETLKKHHRARADEVIKILGETGGSTAFSVASRMTWDTPCESWETFPLRQKWFATGEAIAHLRYLADEGRVLREKRGDVNYYSLID